MEFNSRCGWCRRTSAAAAVVFVAGLAPLAGAQGWPELRHGKWDITRTIEGPDGGAPRTVTTSKCMTPSDDWERQNAQLTKAGCTFSPVKRDSSSFTFTSACKVMGTVSSSTTTIVAEGDSAFTLTVVGTTDGKPTREVMKARRVGDCAK